MVQDIAPILRTIALALGALLPIINPLGLAPVFRSMTRGASAAARTALARRIASSSCLLLIAAMLVGSYVLNLFGLSEAIIKIAGGLLVIRTGWHLITADESPDANLVKTAPDWGTSEIARQSFYPLTFPLTIGPGSVSVAITLGAGARDPGLSVLVGVTGSVLGIVVIGLAIYLSYRYAARLLDMLGDTGTIVLLRLSSFILLSVGMQIFCSGLAERFPVFR